MNAKLNREWTRMDAKVLLDRNSVRGSDGDGSRPHEIPNADRLASIRLY
jgi:hypothetical protein